MFVEGREEEKEGGTEGKVKEINIFIFYRGDML